MRLAIPALLAAALVSATAQACPPPLALVITPSVVTEACAVAGGTLVSQASTTGGDGNVITYSMTGNTTDFVINSATGAVTIVPGGVAPADCGKPTYNNTVTATQP